MKKFLNKIEQFLGFRINNIELYNKAITHKSADKTNIETINARKTKNAIFKS